MMLFVSRLYVEDATENNIWHAVEKEEVATEGNNNAIALFPPIDCLDLGHGKYIDELASV